MPVEDELRALAQRLTDREYKLTPQRRMILRAFVENRGRHLSADDVFGLVKPDHPEIGLATVYRTLDLLSELGVLSRSEFGDGRARYELAERASQHRHHHLICRRCGRVEEVRGDLLEAVEAMIRSRHGFRTLDHDVKFFGLCRACDDPGGAGQV